jgi:fatty-acyl-CoA synthase
MHLSILLDMSADALADRPAYSDASGTITYGELRDQARALAHRLQVGGHERTVFLGTNSLAVPRTLFATALAGTAFTPLNYRLTDPELRRIAERAAPAVAIVDADMVQRLEGVEGLDIVTTDEAASIATAPAEGELLFIPDTDAIGVLLFTSGTTGEPKAAVLRHSHLSSYVLQTLDFASAGEDEAALVSVPPYHIAGISAVISSLFIGRRVVYLPAFTPEVWVGAASEHAITHAMVVPTMLGRVLDAMEATDTLLPSLRHLSYGGGRMPVEVVQRAMEMLPNTGFVNAYGLTETSSTIAVLGPDDHREALASDDPDVRRRLGSVGRPSPAIEVSIRDELGEPVPAGTPGEIWVRGDQVSGEYVGRESRAVDGWFPTNDGGWLDAGGFLYVTGRLDDVIVRGGENISPGEIEDVLREYPGVADVAVVGVPSQEWGEEIAAAVVAEPGAHPEPAELADFVRQRLRSTKQPARIRLFDELPYNETGKLLRRVVRQTMAAEESS